MRAFLVLLVAACAALGNLSENYTGYGDVAHLDTVDAFNADSLAYTKAFKLSAYEDVRIDILVDDTTNAGFDGDSCHFEWGIQTGHLVKNASGTVDTLWNPVHVVVDTVNTVSWTVGPQYTDIEADGTYDDVFGVMDTSEVTGFAVQSRSPVVAWDVLFRVYLRGLASNLVGEEIFPVVNVVNRLHVNVK